MFSSLKILFLEGYFGGVCPNGGPPNLVRTIVSQASSYIVSSTVYVEQFKSFVFFWEGKHFKNLASENLDESARKTAE